MFYNSAGVLQSKKKLSAPFFCPLHLLLRSLLHQVFPRIPHSLLPSAFHFSIIFRIPLISHLLQMFKSSQSSFFFYLSVVLDIHNFYIFQFSNFCFLLTFLLLSAKVSVPNKLFVWCLLMIIIIIIII